MSHFAFCEGEFDDFNAELLLLWCGLFNISLHSCHWFSIINQLGFPNEKKFFFIHGNSKLIAAATKISTLLRHSSRKKKNIKRLKGLKEAVCICQFQFLWTVEGQC